MRLFNPHHLLNAGRYGLQGLVHAFRQENAFRHEVLVLIILAVVLAVTRPGFGTALLVVAAWLAVMIVELLNSAIEGTLDLISLEQNPQIGRAKDMASGAVLLGVICNAALWAYLLFV